MNASQYIKYRVKEAVLENSVSGARLPYGESPSAIIIKLGDVEKIKSRSLMGPISMIDAIQFIASMKIRGVSAVMNGHVTMKGLDVIGEWDE